MRTDFGGDEQEVTDSIWGHGYETIDEATQEIVDRNAQSYTAETNMS